MAIRISLLLLAIALLGFAPAPVPTLTCAPGVPIVLIGNGPAHAAFLLYFGGRAVSGGSVKADGRFSINLVVGHEQPGNYPVAVQLRGTSAVLLGITCIVPGAIPVYVPGATPTPFVVAAPTPTSVPLGPECDPSYPDFCIPRFPPDLNCKDMPSIGFTVLPPDPHRLDGNQNGIGCEDFKR